MKNKPCVEECLANDYGIHVVDNGNALDAAIVSLKPKLICFDYDLPDQYGLDAQQKIKARYPSLPCIVITDDHSTELAIWALRSRVWDYYLKPVSILAVLSSVTSLLSEPSEHKSSGQNNPGLEPDVPSANRPYKTKANGASTVYAIDYVKQHLANKIAVESMAIKCGMSRSHFSRTFKKEHDITFQEYIIQQRMNKAVKLLKNSDLHVTQIALAVGYRELSNFTSTFQRVIGIGPSNFRKALMPKHFKNQLYN